MGTRSWVSPSAAMKNVLKAIFRQGRCPMAGVISTWRVLCDAHLGGIEAFGIAWDADLRRNLVKDHWLHKTGNKNEKTECVL
jgi:hypothetical protein